MAPSRSMIALAAILAAVAAGLLIGLSQWSAHLARRPDSADQVVESPKPDMPDTPERSADETKKAGGTDKSTSSNESSPPSTTANETPTPPEPVASADPTLGDSNAPVTIIEFGEFYCPYCAEFMWETFPKLEKTYIETDKVRYVFRNLTVHGMASIESAVAAECAHAQDAFWTYADALFKRIFPEQNVSDSQHLETNDLKELAANIELDMRVFNRCLDRYASLASQCEQEFQACQSGDTSDADACNAAYVDCLNEDPKFASVMDDRESLSALINDLPKQDQQRAEQIGTPTFFINGRLLIGAQPFSAFEEIIKEELERASSSP